MSVVWGVDLSTLAVDVCIIDRSAVGFATIELKGPGNLPKDPVKRTGPQRLRHALEQVEQWTWEAGAAIKPDVVYVERPTGKHPSPQLMMTCGVVAMAMETSLRLLGRPGIVHVVTIGEWKKAAVGKGNAGKDDVMAMAMRHLAADDELAARVRQRQDWADALGIAICARKDLAAAAAARPVSPTETPDAR